MINRNQILRAIGCPFLSLNEGNGYWYFVYSNPNGNIYEDRSIYVYRMNELSLDAWVEEGRGLIEKAEALDVAPEVAL
jgi:hypothetical protein